MVLGVALQANRLGQGQESTRFHSAGAARIHGSLLRATTYELASHFTSVGGSPPRAGSWMRGVVRRRQEQPGTNRSAIDSIAVVERVEVDGVRRRDWRKLSEPFVPRRCRARPYQLRHPVQE